MHTPTSSSPLRPVQITELLVCTTCRPAGTPREGPAPGQWLWQEVRALVQAQLLPAGVRVRGIACLSACGRACTVALQAPGKHTYCFGDLQPGPAVAGQVLACAALHQASPDGNLPRSERPEALQAGILLRLPFLQPEAAAIEAPAAAQPVAG